VCSTTEARIAQICRAIEELADSSSEPGCELAPSAASTAEDHRPERLAAIWAMIADIDPDLAKRMRGYLAGPE
jgi:hypothetical protein